MHQVQAHSTYALKTRHGLFTALDKLALVGNQEIAVAPEDRPTLPRSGHCMVALPAAHADDVLLVGGQVPSLRATIGTCSLLIFVIPS